MKTKLVFTLWPLPVFLMSCGGSGGGADGLGETRPPDGYTSFADLMDQATVLSATWLGAPISDPSALPVSGNATYDGVARMTLDIGGTETDLAGELALSADFSGSTISGTILGISDAGEQIYPGTLLIVNGTIDRSAVISTDYTITADLNGVLQAPLADMTIDGIVQGDFLGASHPAVSGAILGTVTGGGDSGVIFGDFFAVQP